MMKKITKRLVCSLLIFAMAFGALAGCGKKEEENKAAGDRVLNVAIPQNATITSYEDNDFTEYIEESLDIDIEFTYYSSNSDEYCQQIALLAASGKKMPDVFWGFWTLDAHEYGSAGYMIDLTELIEEHAPNYNEHFAALSPELQERAKLELIDPETGGYYAMPHISAQKEMDNLQNLVYINKTWLDACGKSIPTTVDELYDVLVAFKTMDPNGNGENDEIPMYGAASQAEDLAWFLINPYVYYNNDSFWNATNGKIWCSVTTDEYREALIFMNKLCAEGLYSDLSFTATSTTDKKELNTPSNGEAKVGIIAGHPLIDFNYASELLEQYVALPYLKGETSLGGYTALEAEYIYAGSFISKDCKNPELAMEFLDFFYADETVTRMRHGKLGEDWVRAEEPEIDQWGNEITIQILNPTAFTTGDSCWAFNGMGIITRENYVSQSNTNPELAGYSRICKESQQIMLNAVEPKEIPHVLQYTSEEEDERQQYYATLRTEVFTSRCKFITGDKNPNSDAEWNAYLKDLENLQLTRLIELAQNAYDRVK